MCSGISCNNEAMRNHQYLETHEKDNNMNHMSLEYMRSNVQLECNVCYTPLLISVV